MRSLTQESEAALAGESRSRSYLKYLIIMMGLVAVMDQYLSTIKTTAIPYIIEEYAISAPDFSWLEALYLISSFLVFALNGLNDIIGRKWSILVLILLMGFSSLTVLLFSSSIHLFMISYALIMLTTVSNMWTIPISEESPAEQRARNVTIAYVIGLIPLQALLPPLLLDVLGLGWRWMYGIMFLFMVPVLVMWSFMKETGRYAKVGEERRAGTRRRHILGLGVIDKRDLCYIAVSAAIWLCWLVYSILYFWSGYYFITVKGYSLSEWSMVLLATLIMAMIGGLAGGRLMDRFGRRRVLIVGCAGLAIFLVLLGFAEGALLPIVATITGFFTSLTYTWVVVYVPEIFPTERRGTCMGWTTTIARISYVAGPALAAVLLKAFPTMEWFWVAAAVVALLPVGIVMFFRPHETSHKQLEQIESDR